ncbi:hypothethical protein [Ralstonia solanacearum PSI07]|nr:hypothethical protein [Ralstonia solanacearum PSI07]
MVGTKPSQGGLLMEANTPVCRYGFAHTIEKSWIRECPVCQFHYRFRSNETKLLVKRCFCKRSIIQFCEIRISHRVSIQQIISL